MRWRQDALRTHRAARIDAFVGPLSDFTFANLKDVPRQIDSHGTYQQAIELSLSTIKDENILPPGQSGFTSLSGQRSPHAADQWPLHVNWEFKDMIFGPVSRPGDFDGDAVVGFKDFALFAVGFGAREGESNYSAAFDLNSDGVVDFSDFSAFAALFGTQYS